MSNNTDYPYIRAWGSTLGSSAAYIVQEVGRARQMKAPEDAIYYREQDGWHTYGEVTSLSTRAQMAHVLKTKFDIDAPEPDPQRMLEAAQRGVRQLEEDLKRARDAVDHWKGEVGKVAAR